MMSERICVLENNWCLLPNKSNWYTKVIWHLTGNIRIANLLFLSIEESVCGQSYKHFTLVNYDSIVVPDWKIPQITTLES